MHHVHKLMKEASSSHLMEVVLAVMPPPLFTEFHSRFFKGRLIGLSNHHCANFVIQSALAACRSSQQVMTRHRSPRTKLLFFKHVLLQFGLALTALLA